MVEPFEWGKIDISTHLLPNMTSFNVDVNGFHYMYTTDKLKYYNGKSDIYYDKFNVLLDLINGDECIPEKYLIEEHRVIPFVYSIRERKALKDLSDNNNASDIKYLRFYPYKGKYIVTDDCTPIEWKLFMRMSFVF